MTLSKATERWRERNFTYRIKEVQSHKNLRVGQTVSCGGSTIGIIVAIHVSRNNRDVMILVHNQYRNKEYWWSDFDVTPRERFK